MWKTIDCAPRDRQITVIDMLADIPRSCNAFYAKLPQYSEHHHWFVGHPEDWEPNSFYQFRDAVAVLGTIVPTHWQEVAAPTQGMVDEYTMIECMGAA